MPIRAILCSLGILGGLTALPVQAAPKDSAICLQYQLRDLGYRPGPADGDITPETLNAWRSFLAEHPFEEGLTPPELSDKTAFFWCRTLGLTQPALQAHWPSRRAGPLADRIHSDPEIEASKKALLHAGFTRAQTYFETEFGIGPVAHIDIVGADTPDELRNLISDWAKRRDIAPIDVPIVSAAFCAETVSAAIATRHLMALCWHALGTDSARAWTAAHQELYALIAHEYTHLLQFELAHDFPVRLLPGSDDTLLGPAWLLEGTAEYFSDVMDGRPRAQGKTGLFWIYLDAYRFDMPLGSLRVGAAQFDTENYVVGHFAARLLADRFGPAALLDYWTYLGRFADRAQAFEAAFGLSLQQFETRFDTLRRDIGQARKFTQAR